MHRNLVEEILEGCDLFENEIETTAMVYRHFIGLSRLRYGFTEETVIIDR